LEIYVALGFVRLYEDGEGNSGQAMHLYISVVKPIVPIYRLMVHK